MTELSHAEKCRLRDDGFIVLNLMVINAPYVHDTSQNFFRIEVGFLPIEPRDGFEDDFYRRETVPVTTPDATATDAFAYVVPPVHRSLLSTRPWDRDAFVSNTALEQELLDGLVALGESEEVAFVEEDWNTSLPAIELRLKAILARTLFDTTAFYEVFNPINPIYNRGIEVLRDGTYKASGVTHR